MSTTTQNQQETAGGAAAAVSTDLKTDLFRMVSVFLGTPIANGRMKEMEVRFGTNPRLGNLTKLQYDSVIQHLYAAGFECKNTRGKYYLRIYSEYVDPKEGRTKMSNIRAEIVGADMISEYCRTNSLQHLIDMPSTVVAMDEKIKFTQKLTALDKNKQPVKAIHFEDMGYRVAHQLEQDYSVHSNVAKNILHDWSNTKKIYRHINRVQFVHPHLPFAVDMSIVRSSAKKGNVALPQYTVQDAKLFTQEPSYEIELEVLREKVGWGTKYSSEEQVLEAMRNMVRVVLSGIQGSTFPIGLREKNDVGLEYMRMIHGKTYEPRRDGRLMPRDFIGYSSVALQLEHIGVPDSKNKEPNIRNGYTVTDKADGERKMMFISDTGKVYFIDTNMNISFVGVKVEDKTLHKLLLDGELITHDKYGKLLNLYAVFDVYFVGGKSIRELPFASRDEMDENKKFRMDIMEKVVSMLHFTPITKSASSSSSNVCAITVKCKQFELATEGNTIFDCCNRILSQMNNGLFQYNTDGLIFTPAGLGVCATKAENVLGFTSPNKKETWMHSFKWKPPQYNTVDFLVSVRKDKNGKDEVHTMFHDGTQMDKAQNLMQYKTLVLRCGFDETRDGYLNPFQTMLFDTNTGSSGNDTDQPQPGSKSYFPAPFVPTQPYDANAYLCNVELHTDGHGGMFMQTEEGEYFEEDMIVEFRHDTTLEGAWRWKPLRVRYDKTSALRSGASEYGNAYKTANSNWRSIYIPITEDMLSTGENIPDIVENEDVYYNSGLSETNTQSLRDFHNLYVKRKLITGVAHRGDTLIDYAVGKAGDLPKWVDSNLSFVFGVDVSKDNINNRLNGACARYLSTKKTKTEMPDALFVNGNSALNLRDGTAFSTEKEKMLAKAVFGTGARDKQALGNMVYSNYGVGHSGFQISSVQFALHYFFENATTFYSFIQNVVECTKVGGYFIGTCYDGASVFKMLSSKMVNESVSLYRGGRKIFELTKEYEQTGFPDTELSLGYPITVYQESINKEFREYLVNFEFLVRTLDNFGFVLVSKDDARHMGLPNASGLFSDLFKSMEFELNRGIARSGNYKQAPYMSPEEKQISFLNRYFVFHKKSHVDVKSKVKILLRRETEQDDSDAEQPSGIEGITKLASKFPRAEPEKEPVAPTVPAGFIRKIDHPKFIIRAFDEVRLNNMEEITLVSANKLGVETVPEISSVPVEVAEPSISTKPSNVIAASAIVKTGEKKLLIRKK